MKLKKYKTISKYMSMVFMTIELIFIILQNILEIKYSIDDPNNKEIHLAFLNKQRRIIEIIIGNIVINIILVIIILIDKTTLILISGIFYSLIGVISFTFFFLNRYSTKSKEARPIEYYQKNIKNYLFCFCILGCLNMVFTSICIIICFIASYKIKKKILEEQKLLSTIDKDIYYQTLYKTNLKHN